MRAVYVYGMMHDVIFMMCMMCMYAVSMGV